MDVDGEANTVVATETVAPPTTPENPYGLALVQRSDPLTVEGGFDTCRDTQRAWKVTGATRRNGWGASTAYELAPTSRAWRAGR